MSPYRKGIIKILSRLDPEADSDSTTVFTIPTSTCLFELSGVLLKLWARFSATSTVHRAQVRSSQGWMQNDGLEFTYAHLLLVQWSYAVLEKSETALTLEF